MGGRLPWPRDCGGGTYAVRVGAIGGGEGRWHEGAAAQQPPRPSKAPLTHIKPPSTPPLSSASGACEFALPEPACGYSTVSPVDAVTFTVTDDVPVKAAAYTILQGCGGGSCGSTVV